MPTLELRHLPLADLIPAPFHTRRVLSPRSAAYRKLRAGLAAFGLVEPLVWNELTGHLVGGHFRLALLKELEVAEVPVSVVRLSDAPEKALSIALNNQEVRGRFAPQRLAEVLRELEPLPEFALTGFDSRVFSTLHLTPAAAPRPDPKPPRVEITLVTDPATLDRLAPELDALIARHDLVTHVRRDEL